MLNKLEQMAAVKPDAVAWLGVVIVLFLLIVLRVPLLMLIVAIRKAQRRILK